MFVVIEKRVCSTSVRESGSSNRRVKSRTVHNVAEINVREVGGKRNCARENGACERTACLTVVIIPNSGGWECTYGWLEGITLGPVAFTHGHVTD
jgi:hypothetical protein